MASEKQRELFGRLVDSDKTMPEGSNIDALKQQFSALSDKEASRWIERALDLPDKGDTGAAVPF